MPLLDPLYRLSEHFVLADFLGNQSVYAKGLPNGLDEDDIDFHKKLRNAETLCDLILEPLVRAHGPLSVSYGYISPEMSRRIVTYQDPDKPSHHRWDLGAAADICVHNWVEGCDGLDVTANSPAALAAHMLHDDGASFPLSRLITYSESPFMCVAAATEEARRCTPRLAIYENRYEGRSKVKPAFNRYMNPRARQAFHREMQDPDALLEHGWRGAGYPTHHGGGVQQYHHRRVSQYTMVSDWLFDLQTIAKGARNNPKLSDDATLDAFAAAGIVYDMIINHTGIMRMSIVEGYNARSGWGRGDQGQFTVIVPGGVSLSGLELALEGATPYALGIGDAGREDSVQAVTFQYDVEEVLDNAT